LPGSKKKKKGGGEEQVAKYKALITEVYKEHNPSKLDDIDGLLTKYKGREESLYQSVCEKYKVTPQAVKDKEPEATTEAPVESKKDDEPAKQETPVQAADEKKETVPPAATAAPAVNRGPQQSPVLALKEAFVDLIKEVYTDQRSEKLEGMEKLLERYEGQEQELYLMICKKYKVKAKDPEGLGDFEWMQTAEEELARLLEVLVSFLVLHMANLKTNEITNLAAWQRGRRRPPPRSMTHTFELAALGISQLDAFLREIQGSDGKRGRKLSDRCVDVELSIPSQNDVVMSKQGLAVKGIGGGPKGRMPFDNAVGSVTDAVIHAVRDCMDQAEGTARSSDKWTIPWSGEEILYIIEFGPNGDPVRKEVGVEYRRGCLSVKRRPPLHHFSLHHNLCGPDVETKLPTMWRQVADKLWGAISSLKIGSELPADVVVVVEVRGGHDPHQAAEGMCNPCSGASPAAMVVVTAPIESEIDQAKKILNSVLARVLSDLRLNALFAPTALSMPQVRTNDAKIGGLPQKPRDGYASGSESDEMVDDDESEEIMSDVEPSDNYRPLRLHREKVRDAYLQGLLCLNCDAADHKHQDCPLKKKVCWNCHGNHPGNDCPLRCRFCKERHTWPLLECVKRVCRRVSDWKKSKPAQEQKHVLSSFEQLAIKLEGFEDLDLAKHNRDIQRMVKELSEHGALWPDDLEDVATSILDMKPPQKKSLELITPPPPPGAPPKISVAPILPKESPPDVPDPKYPWQEKIFLDDLVSKGVYGSNILSRILGRGGLNHRRMETESGARVFLRGLGVSGRDVDMKDPLDARLHIAVKGEVPQQGKTVRRIVAELVDDLDREVAERGEMGPRLDRPRDPQLHPFGFMLPKGTGPDPEASLRFKFPEEDGSSLNEVLDWLKTAKVPMELDSDTQWRTTLSVTPANPALPDDAPPEAEEVADAFDRLVDNWHFPSPYWYEEQDLRPTGLWTPLTTGEEDDNTSNIGMQTGQGVRLTDGAVRHFAMLMDQADLAPGVSRSRIETVLRRLRGTIRRSVQDEELLLFLAYPWAWFSEPMARGGLRLPFSRPEVHQRLISLGRIGAKPTESLADPPFKGFSVEWSPIRPGAVKASTAPRPIIAPAVVPVAQDSWAADLGPPAPLPVPAAGTQMPVPASTAPVGWCRVYLPEGAYASGSDLYDMLSGPQGAHIGHLLKKYPNVSIRIEGRPSLAAAPDQRLHIHCRCEDADLFEKASSDVMDLVETVCDMIAEELSLPNDQLESMIRSIPAEKYFGSHGHQTKLSFKRGTDVAGVKPMDVAARTDADFEFLDDVDAQPDDGDDDDDGDDTEDDASTQASEEDDDAMSAISEEL